MTAERLQKVYLRFHARLILSIVALTGFASSHFLLKYAEIEILYRYPLAAFIAYVLFVILMFGWKHYLESLSPIQIESPSRPSKSIVVDEKRKWYDYLDIPTLSGDWDEIFIVIFAIALFVGLIYVSSYIVIEIPVLMIDVLVSGLATSVLYKPIKKADDDIFIFKVLRQTLAWGIFLVLIYFLFKTIIQSTCPTAQKFSDVFTSSSCEKKLSD